jgi:hypothetical protein
MEAQMPYRKILISTLQSFIQSKVVWLNGIMLWFMSAEVSFFEGIKVYAVLIGAIYTTIKFYKDFVRESEYWAAFKKWNSELLKAIVDVKNQLNKRDGKDASKPD